MSADTIPTSRRLRLRTFGLLEKEDEALRRMAAESGKSASEIVRGAVRIILDEWKKRERAK